MLFFISTSILIVFGIVFLILGVSLQNRRARFLQHAKTSEAEVVGYKRESHWDGLLVKIPDLNDDKEHYCISSKISTADYPVGSKVMVSYCHMTTMGFSTIEVHLNDNPPADMHKAASVFIGMAIAAYGGAAALAIVRLVASSV